MNIFACRGVVINAPEIFSDPDFRFWLTNGEAKLTWWCGGEIDEWSDVVVLVDPNLSGEGSDSDMPAHIWNRIIEACRARLSVDPGHGFHYMVRLTNLLL